MAWKIFRLSIIISVIALITAFYYGGLTALITVALLGILEISLSFDNAIITSRTVQKLSKKWQQLFLTVGILVAVFLVRFLVPIGVVSAVSGLSPVAAVNLAFAKGDPNVEGTYGYIMHHAHPMIAAFGGLFLLMIAINFLFEKKEHYWLSWIEKPLTKVGNIEGATTIVALGVLIGISAGTGSLPVAISGLLGIITYLIINTLSGYFENKEEELAESEASSGNSKAVVLVGKAAFMSFLYLEVLDASFSLDGVVAAFAITPDPILIMLGLGLIGALFVRSMTIYLVRKGTLDDYVYLDHGAHWAIFSLAILLFVSITTPIPELVTGLLSVAILITAFVGSVLRNKKLIAEGREDEIEETDHVEGLGNHHVVSADRDSK